MATYSSILGWRIPWTEEPGKESRPMRSQRVRHSWDTHTRGFRDVSSGTWLQKGTTLWKYRNRQYERVGTLMSSKSYGRKKRGEAGWLPGHGLQKARTLVSPHTCRRATGIVCETVWAMKHGRRREEDGPSLPWSLRRGCVRQPEAEAAGHKRWPWVITLVSRQVATTWGKTLVFK